MHLVFECLKSTQSIVLTKNCSRKIIHVVYRQLAVNTGKFRDESPDATL